MCIYGKIWGNASSNEKRFRRKLYRQSKHTICTLQLFPENRAVCVIMWESVVWTDRPQVAVQFDAGKICFACRITKARTKTHRQRHTLTHTHTLYLSLLAFPSQQWSRDHATQLSYTFTADLVKWLSVCHVAAHLFI